jgi:hypothetical protein
MSRNVSKINYYLVSLRFKETIIVLASLHNICTAITENICCYSMRLLKLPVKYDRERHFGFFAVS